MKTNVLKGAAYKSPELSVLEIKTEGVLCASGDAWYDRDGQGDFTYGTETDDTWA